MAFSYGAAGSSGSSYPKTSQAILIGGRESRSDANWRQGGRGGRSGKGGTSEGGSGSGGSRERATLIFCGRLAPADFETALKRLEEEIRELEVSVQFETMGQTAGKKAAIPFDEPGFIAAQMFAIAAETDWPE